ncbi:MAG: DEAD/DEAH box helicase [Candidatus Paceibacterota bacterium]
MIKIDLHNNRLIIDIDNKLKTHQSLQLNVSYGFEKYQDNQKFITTNNLESKLSRLIPFLQDEGIEFKLTDSCKEFYDSIKEKKLNFQEFVNKAETFKDANFDPDDFQAHLNFLKTKIKRQLRDHQKKAFYHLCKVKNGANFSVPGSGKTTVVLSAYEKAKFDDKINLLFVIGPPACFGPWQNEFLDVLGRSPDTLILAGGSRYERKEKYYELNNLSELYLTTFQTLMQDENEVRSFLQHPNVNAFVVIDEAHYIKQIDGSWANAALSIGEIAKRRCVLTGTPIPKSYTDLFNLFDFLWPENSVVTDEQKGLLELFEKNKDFEKATEILDPVVGPLFYRVRKKELGLKPQIFHKPIKIEMNDHERRIYNAIVGKIRHYESMESYLRDSISDVVIQLKRGRMMRLRQTLSFAKLLHSAIDEYNEDLLDDDLAKIILEYDELERPAKLEYLLQMVENFQSQKQKVVIWANFIGTIDLIENELTKNGYYCKKIYGQTPVAKEKYKDEETREKIRDEFVDSNSGLDVLIANPAACAESISLHKTCFHAVYYDLSYNCAQYLQSLDRIHRVGGSEDNEAHYYFLQYDNTVEPKILSNLNVKAQKMYEIIEGDYNIYSLDMFDENDDLDLSIYNMLFKK